jgi:hypothetical protein
MVREGRGVNDVGATRLIHGWRYSDAAELVDVASKMSGIAKRS